MQHTTSCVVECGLACPCPCHKKPIEMVSEIEKQFLEESNEIEGVWDFVSLDQAIYAWQYLKEHPKLNTHVILKAHKILMLKQSLMPNEKGYFRTIPVYIAGRECPVLSPDGWTLSTVVSQWCHESTAQPQMWKIHHIAFEKIHPFVDGNGRLGRMLMNWQRLKAGMEILVIREKERNYYYQWFK